MVAFLVAMVLSVNLDDMVMEINQKANEVSMKLMVQPNEVVLKRFNDSYEDYVSACRVLEAAKFVREFGAMLNEAGITDVGIFNNNTVEVLEVLAKKKLEALGKLLDELLN